MLVGMELLRTVYWNILCKEFVEFAILIRKWWVLWVLWVQFSTINISYFRYIFVRILIWNFIDEFYWITNSQIVQEYIVPILIFLNLRKKFHQNWMRNNQFKILWSCYFESICLNILYLNNFYNSFIIGMTSIMVLKLP